MNAFDRLPDAAAEIFGAQATAEQAYGLLTVDVPAEEWTAALHTARTTLGCTFFDWLSAVDEPGTGLRVSAHLVALPDADDPAVRRLLVRTTVPHEAAALPIPRVALDDIEAIAALVLQQARDLADTLAALSATPR